MFSDMSDPPCLVLYTSSKSGVGDICGEKKERKRDGRKKRRRKKKRGGREEEKGRKDRWEEGRKTRNVFLILYLKINFFHISQDGDVRP